MKGDISNCENVCGLPIQPVLMLGGRVRHWVEAEAETQPPYPPREASSPLGAEQTDVEFRPN